MASVLLNILTIIVGLVSQRFFLQHLGVEYLGINGLFSNIVSMMSVVELGLGTAVVYHLYKPVAQNDIPKIKSLMKFYKLGYRFMATLIAGLGLCMMLFLPALVGEVAISESIYLIFGLFILDAVLSYALAYKRSMLHADQKGYIINITHAAYVVIVNILQIIILVSTSNYLLYLAIKVVTRLAENIVLNFIIDRTYPILKDSDVTPLDQSTRSDIFQKMRALLLHKIGSFAVMGSDNIIISIFLGITTVGMYNNYLLIILAINSLASQAFASVTSSIGNLLITESREKTYEVYRNIRFVNLWIATLSATGFIVVVNSFIQPWLGPQYLLGTDVLVALSINIFMTLFRSSIGIFKEAAGIFHEDRYVPLIESLVNIVLSVIFLQFFGLAGVFLGTICSSLVLHLFSYPRYVYTKLFKRRYVDYYLEFFKYIFIAALVAAVSFIVSRLFYLSNDIANLALNVAVALIVPNVMLYLIFKKNAELTYFRKLFAQTINSISRKYIGKKR